MHAQNGSQMQMQDLMNPVQDRSSENTARDVGKGLSLLNGCQVGVIVPANTHPQHRNACMHTSALLVTTIILPIADNSPLVM